MAFFVGEFEQTIDAKHRLSISSSFRDQLIPEEDGKDFVLVLGADTHLRLYPDLYYRKLATMLRRSAIPDSRSGRYDMIFAMARILKPDAHGRVVLPEKSMRRATMADRVTLIGANDHLEIWPTDEWDRHVEQTLPIYGQMLDDAAMRLDGQQGQNGPVP